MSETPEAYLRRISQLERAKTDLALLDEFDTYVTRFARRVKERVDDACLQALQSGRYGVKVTSYKFNGSIQIEVTDEVPFGEIHYHDEYGDQGEYESLHRI